VAISRIKKLKSGLYLAQTMKEDIKDNFALRIDGKYKGAYIHYKLNFGSKFRYEDKDYVSIKTGDIIAIEREGEIIAPGSLVIVKLQYASMSQSIVIPDSAKAQSGEFTGQVISVGPDYPDRTLKIGDHIFYLRAEGYKFTSYASRQEYLSVKECWVYGKTREVL
jgi:co-chaperonin GroES (HSP10)